MTYSVFLEESVHCRVAIFLTIVGLNGLELTPCVSFGEFYLFFELSRNVAFISHEVYLAPASVIVYEGDEVSCIAL